MQNHNEQKDSIPISDYAIVRYLERVKGYDIEALKKEMLSNPNVSKAILQFRSLKIPFAPHQYYIVKDGTIVTVLGEEQQGGFFSLGERPQPKLPKKKNKYHIVQDIDED